MQKNIVAESLALGYDLSDLQLLSVLVGEGIAKKVLEAFPTFESLEKASLLEIQNIKGIGEKTATKVKALVEFSRRLFHKAMGRGETFNSPTQVYNHYGPMFKGKVQEEFYVLLLDVKNRVLKHVQVAKGTLGSCVVDVRDILRPALQEGASSVILIHNHPSGDPSPSEEDYQITQKIKSAAMMVNINVLDHFVVGDESYTSLAERGAI